MLRIMRMTHLQAIIVSGLSWLAIGAFLLYRGLFYLIICLFDHSLSQNAILLLVAIGLVLGFIKGRYVLSKTVERVTKSILIHPAPLKLTKLYSKGYLILIASMMALGISLRFLPIANSIRGVIDTAIGFALMNGALLYFKLALSLKRQKQDR